MNLGPYAKSLNGTVTAVLVALLAALPGGISSEEYVALAIVLVTNAVLIFAANNRVYAYAKTIAGVLAAGLGALGTALSDGGGFAALDTGDLIVIVLALLGNGLVVSQTPNAVRSDFTRAA